MSSQRVPVDLPIPADSSFPFSSNLQEHVTHVGPDPVHYRPRGDGSTHQGSKLRPVGPAPGSFSDFQVDPTPRQHFNFTRAATGLFKPERRVGAAPSVFVSFRRILVDSWLNILLVFVPIMFVVRFTHGPTSEVFAFAFLALLPTAKIFGIAMEDLTLRVDRNTGRFIRFLAGNSIELISGIIATIQCQLEVLLASLVGSILINILLVLGVSREPSLRASGRYNGAGHMLMLGTVAALLPTVFAASFGATTTDDIDATRISILRISRAVSFGLLLCYGLYIVFQFRSHVAQFNAEHKTRGSKYAPDRALTTTCRGTR
ncbi:hypothetical protein C8R46DRAFT_1349450 [Mycena filopes]|nr:hypothetical protein C8R46DRAFT_1349450 [Mycena filopes]